MRRLTLSLVLGCFSCSYAEILLPDPTIFFENGVYYLTGTGVENESAFPIYHSKNLETWSNLKTDGKKFYSAKKKDIFGEKNFWAPQIFKKDGVYYLAYCAFGKASEKKKSTHYLTIAKADKLSDGFKEYVVWKDFPREIDPFIFFDDDGKIYMYFVHWDGKNGIYVQELSNDLKNRIGKMRICVFNEKDWERKPLTEEFNSLNKKHKSEDPNFPDSQIYYSNNVVTEGPTVIKRNGKYILFYSANDYRSPDYCVGYAVSDSPFGPWKKHNAPIIIREITGLNGSGHGDVFFDENGEMWYVFHAHHSNIRINTRRTAVIKLEESFDKDGFPIYKAVYSTLRLL